MNHKNLLQKKKEKTKEKRKEKQNKRKKKVTCNKKIKQEMTNDQFGKFISVQ